MNAFLDRRFGYSGRGSSLRIEALGGLSTFLTMSYILFVNPAILSAAGLPFSAVRWRRRSPPPPRRSRWASSRTTRSRSPPGWG